MSAALTLHGECEHDYMRVNGDPKFHQMLASNSGGNERLIFSIVGVKVNRKGVSQERALVITNRAIYNTIPGDIRKCQRRIPLEKLHHLTVSNSCDNFVLHVIGEYDYYFNCPRLEIIGRVMSDALFQLCSRSLRVDVVPAVDLTDYVISKELAKAGQAWKDETVTRPLSYAVSEPEIQMPKRTAALKARLVGASKLVEELIKRGIRLVIFDFDGVMLREDPPGDGLDLSCSPGPHSLSEGFYSLALELAAKGLSMAVVTNNDKRNILPVLVSNWRWHQRPERHSDFSTIAASSVFSRVQCWDTHRGKRHKKTNQRMPIGNGDAHGLYPILPVEKNGRIRLAIHSAKRCGIMSHADLARDEGVGAQCTLLVDDREENVQAFLRLGGHAYLHLAPHEGLSDLFDLDQLLSAEPDDKVDGPTMERRSAIVASELSDWDWWLEEWRQTPEGGALDNDL